MMTLQGSRAAIYLLILMMSSFAFTGCQSSRQFASNQPLQKSYVEKEVTNSEEALTTKESIESPNNQTVTTAIFDNSLEVQPVAFETEVKGLSLEHITQLALQHNPVIRQAEAAVSKGNGYRYQVGLYPNPEVGYSGSQLADQRTDQHTVYVQQEFVTAQKLERNVNVLCHEVENLKWQAEQQRRTVLSDVKKLYYEVLGSQIQLELTNDLVDTATKYAKFTEDHKKIGEATNIDVLQAQVQLQQLVITQKQVTAKLNNSWKQLTASVGIPEMNRQLLIGELPVKTNTMVWEDEYQRIISQSPEVMSARSRVARSLALLDRQKVQANPNLTVSLSAGYDRATDSQLINTQVGMPIPVYNNNQGNISAAYAEYCRSTHELHRIELSIKSRLADVAKAYESSAASVTLHRDEIIPKTKDMLELADATYKIGEISFLQVLTVRKTFFDANLTYVAARTDLAQAQVLIDELLLSGSLENSPDSNMDDALRGESIGSN